MKQLMSIKEVLDYLEKAPTKFYVSSFSGGAVHVKFLIPEVFNNPQEKETDNDDDIMPLERNTWTPIYNLLLAS